MKKIFIGLLFLISAASYSQIDTLDISRFLNAGNGRRQGSELVKLKTFMLAVNGTNYFIAASNATATEKSIANVLCDGTADQVQINAALTAGYNVKLSSGQFNIASAITAAVSNVTIEGTGKNKTTIFLSNGANSNVITIGGNYWVTKNLLIDANLASNTGSYLSGISAINKTNISIDNCEIKNGEDYGIMIRDASYNWTITKSYIHDSGVLIAGLTFGGVEPYDIKIQNCDLYNSTVGSHVLIQASDASYLMHNWTIDHCTFKGTTGYMGFQVIKGLNCNVTNSYFDVGECIGAGIPGNVRYYTGATGTVSNNTFVGAGLTVSEEFTNINLWGSGAVTITNNYITHKNGKGGTGISIEAYDNSYNVSFVNITGNTFYNIGGTVGKPAVALYAATTYTITDVLITGNIFQDDRAASSINQYAVSSSGAGTIKNISITDNIIEGMLYGGIIMTTTVNSNYVIADNHFIDVGVGIEIDDCDNVMITDNKFTLCTTPIDVNAAAVTYPFIESNYMYGCTNSGTYAGATNEIIGNNVWHDGTYDNTAP